MHENLFEYACDELAELDKKAKSGKLSMSEMQYADLLEHFKKSYLTNAEKMEEYEGMSERGSSREGGSRRGSYRGGSYRGSSREGSSYERGSSREGSYAQRRNRMGQFTRDDEFRSMLEDAMESAPNEQMRSQLERMMQQL